MFDGGTEALNSQSLNRLDRFQEVIRKARARCDLVISLCNITSRSDVRYLWETMAGSIESVGRKVDIIIHENAWFTWTKLGDTANILVTFESTSGVLGPSRDAATSE